MGLQVEMIEYAVCCIRIVGLFVDLSQPSVFIVAQYVRVGLLVLVLVLVYTWAIGIGYWRRVLFVDGSVFVKACTIWRTAARC